ncbi:hypothetical protein DP139_03935 [Clostridium tetani]|nr:hypothetical protein DP139_03935 [Clostridium tetani]
MHCLQFVHDPRGYTRGTETSKYPEEEKEKSIFLVAASEKERAQTRNLFLGLWIDHHEDRL